MTVEWVPIGDVAELVRTPVEVVPDETYRRVGLYSWAKGFLHRPASPGSEMGSLRYFTFPTGSLVLSNIQAWEGAIGVAGEREVGFVASNRFLPYVPTGELDVRYWFHFLGSSQGMELLQKSSPGTTMRNRTLRRDLFEAAKIPLPEIDTQRAIAARLDRARGASELRRGLRVDAIREQIVAEALAGTEFVRFGDLFELQRRARYPQHDEIVREIGVRSFGRGLFVKDWTTGAELGGKRVFTVAEGDLVISNIFAWEGAVALAGSDHHGLVGSHRFMTWVPRDKRMTAEFAATFLTARVGVSLLADASPGSAGRNRTLSISGLESVQMPVPGRQVQQRMEHLMAQLRRAEALAAQRDVLLDSLLPAARNEEFRALLAS